MIVKHLLFSNIRDSGLSFVTLLPPYIYNIDAIIQDTRRVELLAAEVERLKV